MGDAAQRSKYHDILLFYKNLHLSPANHIIRRKIYVTSLCSLVEIAYHYDN